MIMTTSKAMSQDEIDKQERQCSGTSWTYCNEFEKSGYLLIKDIWNPSDLFVPVPHQRGQIYYYGKNPQDFRYAPEEEQVPGSLAVVNRPEYRSVHIGIKQKLEDILKRKLYGTYYYDRFYWSGQKLTKHVDRDACEISLTLHIGSSSNQPWPIWIKCPDEYTKDKKQVIRTGEDRQVILGPGDGMLYKGCERPHWREPLAGDARPGFEEWYHQVFFHYVLQDGRRAQCAWDMGR